MFLICNKEIKTIIEDNIYLTYLKKRTRHVLNFHFYNFNDNWLSVKKKKEKNGRCLSTFESKYFCSWPYKIIFIFSHQFIHIEFERPLQWIIIIILTEINCTLTRYIYYILICIDMQKYTYFEKNKTFIYRLSPFSVKVTELFSL